MSDQRRIDLLAADLGDRGLAEALMGARTQLVRPVPDEVADRHLAAMATALAERPSGDTRVRVAGTAPVMVPLRPPRRWPLERLTRVAAAVLIVLTVSGGLAATGSLPAPAQEFVADSVARLGIELPRPTPPASASGTLDEDLRPTPGGDRPPSAPGGAEDAPDAAGARERAQVGAASDRLARNEILGRGAAADAARREASAHAVTDATGGTIDATPSTRSPDGSGGTPSGGASGSAASAGDAAGAPSSPSGQVAGLDRGPADRSSPGPGPEADDNGGDDGNAGGSRGDGGSGPSDAPPSPEPGAEPRSQDRGSSSGTDNGRGGTAGNSDGRSSGGNPDGRNPAGRNPGGGDPGGGGAGGDDAVGTPTGSNRGGNPSGSPRGGDADSPSAGDHAAGNERRPADPPGREPETLEGGTGSAEPGAGASDTRVEGRGNAGDGPTGPQNAGGDRGGTSDRRGGP